MSSDPHDRETAATAGADSAASTSSNGVSSNGAANGAPGEAAPGGTRAVPTDDPSRPKKRGVPEGLWLRCDGCGETVFRKTVVDALGVCPQCGHHFYISAETRIKQLL